MLPPKQDTENIKPTWGGGSISYDYFTASFNKYHFESSLSKRFSFSSFLFILVKMEKIHIRQGINIVMAMEPLRSAMVFGLSKKAKKIVVTYMASSNITPVKARILLSLFISFLSLLSGFATLP